MGQRTASRTSAAVEDPPDLTTMRATARQLLAPDAPRPAADALETLILTVRGHIEVMLPEVEAAAARVGEDEVMHWCALACVGEARRKLGARRGLEQGSALGYARKLARSLNALCDHYLNLADPVARPDLVAYRHLLEHCSECRTCLSVDDDGRNVGEPCDTGDRLSEAYREARRALPSPR